MNNNFWFNFSKDNEENNEPLIVVEENDKSPQNEQKENNIKINNNTNNKKKAIVKLIIGFIFIVIVIIILNINSGYNTDSTPNDTVSKKPENNSSNSDNLKEIILTGNYSFKQEIIISYNNEEQIYQYTGTKNNNEVLGTKTNNSDKTEFLLKNNEYYIKDKEEYQLVEYSKIYPIDPKYLDIININNYIKQGKLMYKTEYSDGSILKKYNIYLRDILLDNTQEKTFSIITKENNEYYLEIDYTNLLNRFNQNISSLIIKIIYTK